MTIETFDMLPAIASVAQVAAALGWTEAKLRNRLQKGENHPPFHKEGSRIEFRRTDVASWYAGLTTVVSRRQPAPTPGVPRGRRRRNGWDYLEQANAMKGKR